MQIVIFLRLFSPIVHELALLRTRSYFGSLFPLRNGKSRSTHQQAGTLFYGHHKLTKFPGREETVKEGRKLDNAAVSINTANEERAIQALADKVMAQIADIFAAQKIYPNPVQQQMLTSHVRAMALRSITGEPLPEVEADLFEDISAASMALAQQVVDLFGNLPVEEAWMLSVHFEVAKENTGPA